MQGLEVQMDITAHWVSGGPECLEASKLLYMCKYQWALNVLEGLVVAHVFELSKMNHLQTSQPYSPNFPKPIRILNG